MKENEIKPESVPFTLRYSLDELLEMYENINVSPAEESEPKPDNSLPDLLLRKTEVMNEIISVNTIEPKTDDFYVNFSSYRNTEMFFRKMYESAELKRISAFITSDDDEEFKFYVNFFNNVIAEIKLFTHNLHCNNENFSTDKVISFMNRKILEYILDHINEPLSKKYARQESLRGKCRELLSLTHDFLSVAGYYTPPLLIELLQNYDDISYMPNIASFYNVETSNEYEAPIGTISNISPLPYCMRYKDDKGNIRIFVRKGKIITLSGGT